MAITVPDGASATTSAHALAIRGSTEFVQTCRPMSLARLSRLRSAALRLDGDQTAEKATGSGSSAKGKKTMPVDGNSAVAALTMVIPKPCPTMDSSAPRPTSKRRIDGAGQSPAWRSTIWL